MLEQNSPNPIRTAEVEAAAAILRKMAERARVKLPKNVALCIAQNLGSNAPDLELALKRLIAHSALTGTEITLASTQQVLKGLIKAQARETLDLILQKERALRYGAKPPKIGPHYLPAADRNFAFLLLKTGNAGKISRVRQELEVNMREGERECLARRDPYERELECRAKRKQS
jgi:Bacterial dnaA  protein